MDMEISPFGLRSVNIEPGYFRSKLIDPNNRQLYENKIEDYKPVMTAMDDVFKCMSSKSW